MMTKKRSAEKTVRDIRRATRRHYSAEEKIRIVLEGLRGEDSIAELCRLEGINSNVYYRWSKEFLEAGKKRLSGDTVREATSDEVKQLRTEATALKETLAELLMENRLLKKSVIGHGRTIYEVFGPREIRNHPIGRGIQFTHPENTSAIGYSQVYFLQLVTPLPGTWG
jgi:transposase